MDLTVSRAQYDAVRGARHLPDVLKKVLDGASRTGDGYRLHLTNIEPGTWRATFSHDAMTAAEGFAAAPTPWAAMQIAARRALA